MQTTAALCTAPLRSRADRPSQTRQRIAQAERRDRVLGAVRADVTALVRAGYDRHDIGALMGYGSREMVDGAMGSAGTLPSLVAGLDLSSAALAVGGGAVARLSVGIGFAVEPAAPIAGDGDVTAESLAIAEAHGGALVSARSRDTQDLRRRANALIAAGRSLHADADAIDAFAR